MEEEEPQAANISPDQPHLRPAAVRAKESEEASWAEGAASDGGASDEWLRLDTLATRSGPQVRDLEAPYTSSLSPNALVA